MILLPTSKGSEGACATVPFLLLPDCRCQRDPPFLVLLVTSRPAEAAERAAIRRTWGAKRRAHQGRVATYFLLGQGGELGARLRLEARVHRDIIQGDFTDTYDNLTLKVLMGLEWARRHCQTARFFMKTDSDVFVNTPHLLWLLSSKPSRGFFSGQVMHHIQPIQDKRSKWYISPEEFASPVFPEYCSGTGYVFSGDLSSLICLVASSVPFLKLEDAFVGLCLARLGVRPVPMTTRRLFFTRKVPFSVCRYRYLVTSHPVSRAEMLRYWSALRAAVAEDCPPPPAPHVGIRAAE
ncbi:beta-1,3-galactosyltransferase 5-like [Rhinoraja longicauda]